ncbi:MAG: hypothetical protein OFPII_05320 [Osedax symbiont Rs1]|nr:MAG: hypothetical protein OFPII_05320 [Osedax symbiont Rs1]
MKIIDPHLHLFDLSLGDYSWLQAKNPPYWPDKQLINRNFSIADLHLPAPFAHAAFVHIEAGFNNSQPWLEIEWLERQCLQEPVDNTQPLPATTAKQITPSMKTIACIDLQQSTASFAEQIVKLSQYRSIAGFRHILDEHASELLQNSQVQQNLHYLSESGFIFECQLDGADSAAIEQLCRLLARTPRLKIIINHAAFPSLDAESFITWQANMQKLASFSNLYIKASGWEMFNRAYDSHQIETIVTLLIGYFSLQRVMLASNFPLCLFSCSYTQLWQTYWQLAFSEPQKRALMYDNARCFYQF